MSMLSDKPGKKTPKIYVTARDPKTGKPIKDPKTGKPLKEAIKL